MTDIVTNLENKFKENDLSKVKDEVPLQGAEISSHLKIHFLFWKMFS